MISILCQMASVQIWTQPAPLSQWSMSSLQSVPFLPSGDLSNISKVDDVLHSWHQGVNDYHYSCTLFSRFRKQTKYAVTVSSCQMAHHLPPLSHTILFTQASQKITFFRIFYFNHYLLIKNLLRSSVSFWGKLAKLPFFLLIRSSHVTQSSINSLIIQVLRGSKYNERKTVFYMNYPSVRDGRAVRTYLPFPSGE